MLVNTFRQTAADSGFTRDSEVIVWYVIPAIASEYIYIYSYIPEKLGRDCPKVISGAYYSYLQNARPLFKFRVCAFVWL